MIALTNGMPKAQRAEFAEWMQHVSADCSRQIWPRAAHNIPPLFAKRFNALADETASEHSAAPGRA